MPVRQPEAGGGWNAIRYVMRLAARTGWWTMWKALRSRNACKTCALGMGGQNGGMVSETGRFPEVCKKSVQAAAADMQKGIPDDFWTTHSVDRLRALSPRQLEHSGRLVRPLIREQGSRYFRPVSWDEALNRAAGRMAAAGPQRSFFYASGRSGNEAGFLLQILARRFGTNAVHNCSYYCHQASGAGLTSCLGTGTGTIRLEDLDDVDLYFLIGANPASNHPRLMKTLMEIRRRGGRVIVVNPVREPGLQTFRVPSDIRSLLTGSSIASRWVRPHAGGDLAMLAGMCRELLDRGAQDQDFIDAHTHGFPEFRRSLEELSWDDIEQSSGLSRREIRELTDEYVAARHVVFGWCMGVTHHLHGTRTVQLMAATALLRGMVGRPGAGLMPIRGHSNVQGMGSVGVTPVLNDALAKKLEQEIGLQIPKTSGGDTMQCMQAAHRGDMDFALCLGGNLYGSNPHSAWASDALNAIGTMVFLSTTLNTGHAWGHGRETIILPVLARDEEPHPTTQESMFSYVRYSEGGPARHAGPRSEVDILARLAQKVCGTDGPVDFTSLSHPQAIRQLIGRVVPGYQDMATIDATRSEFHVRGRHPLNGRFPTADGRARFHPVKLPPPSCTDDQLRLLTVRSEGQFNTVVYDEEDLYRGQERRDVVLMNADDMAARKLVPDQPVRVRSAVGELRWYRARVFDVRPGNVLMYCPEASVLVPHDVDPLSRTPGFKGIPVTVTAETAAMR